MPETFCGNHLQPRNALRVAFEGRRQRHQKLPVSSLTLTLTLPLTATIARFALLLLPLAATLLLGALLLMLRRGLAVDAAQVLAVDAVQALAVPVAFDPGLPGLSVEQGIALELPAEPLRRFFVVAAGEGQTGRPAGMAQAARHAGCPVTFGFPAEASSADPAEARPIDPAEAPSADPADALPTDPAAQARGPFGRAAPVRAAGPAHHAAGNGTSRCEYCVAALTHGDNDPRHTGAGRSAVALAPAQKHGSTCPNRGAAAPSHCPSDHPSVAAHPAASRGSMQEAPGSSAPGCAGRTTAPPADPRIPTVRCTRNSRTSCLPGKPSTYHRRRNNLNPLAARSRPGSPGSG